LKAYITWRKAWCVYDPATSSQFILRSLAIFYFYVSDCLTNGDILESYVDDFSLLESDSNLAALDLKLQKIVDEVLAWAARKKLTIASLKSQLTLFTPWMKQVNTCPNVSMDGIPLILNKTPKILGVTFDSLFCFARHIAAIAAKVHQRLNLLKAVSGSSWGHDKEMLLFTFRALVESVYNFAAAVWFPNTKPSNVNKLQMIQNATMRLITECHMATSQDHLHGECNLLPVDEHLSMLCVQFLASCLRPSHPSNATVKLQPGPRKNQHGRRLKETLSSCFHDAVSPYLWGDLISSGLYNKIKNDIHTVAVQNYLTSANPNKVLCTRSPAVKKSERTLP
jgi:hypothetical protein